MSLKSVQYSCLLPLPSPSLGSPCKYKFYKICIYCAFTVICHQNWPIIDLQQTLINKEKNHKRWNEIEKNISIFQWPNARQYRMQFFCLQFTFSPPPLPQPSIIRPVEGGGGRQHKQMKACDTAAQVPNAANVTCLRLNSMYFRYRDW